MGRDNPQHEFRSSGKWGLSLKLRVPGWRAAEDILYDAGEHGMQNVISRLFAITLERKDYGRRRVVLGEVTIAVWLLVWCCVVLCGWLCDSQRGMM